MTLFLDFISDDKLLQELNDRWNEISPNLLMFNFSVESDRDKNHISNAIRQFYFGDRPISKVTVKEIIQVAELHFILYLFDLVVIYDCIFTLYSKFYNFQLLL